MFHLPKEAQQVAMRITTIKKRVWPIFKRYQLLISRIIVK